MLHRIVDRRRTVAALTAVLACCLAPSTGNAQRLGTKDDSELPFIKLKEPFNALLKGDASPDANKNKALLTVAGKYFVYRVTWTEIQNEPYKDGMGKVQKDFEQIMQEPATAQGKNKEFMKQLAHEIVTRLKEVLAQKMETSTMAVTNASLMLPVLAKCKQPEVVDFLLTLTKADAQGKGLHPFVRMCAIKGLGESMAAGGLKLDLDLPKQLAVVDAIVQFIARPYAPEGQNLLTEGERQQYTDAYVYVRREGVKALARIPVPALEMKNGKVTGPVAYHLLNIASGGSNVEPPFTLAEKLEAAIGLCFLKETGQSPRYNTALAAYVVGENLVDMATSYLGDYQYFSVKVGKEEPKRTPLIPWKSYAINMDAGLNALAANLPKDSTAGKNFEDLRITAKKTLDFMGRLNPIDQPLILQKTVDALRPPGGEVYPGSKEFVLTIPPK